MVPFSSATRCTFGPLQYSDKQHASSRSGPEGFGGGFNGRLDYDLRSSRSLFVGRVSMAGAGELSESNEMTSFARAFESL